MRKTKSVPKTGNLTKELNDVAKRSEGTETSEVIRKAPLSASKSKKERPTGSKRAETSTAPRPEIDPAYEQLFENWDANEFVPEDFMDEVAIDSLESVVGYSSLFRQMHKGFLRRVAFYKSPSGGSLSVEEARAKAFHACSTKEEAMKEFQTMMRLPLDSLNFADLLELHDSAPRVAERLWENAKLEGQKEFLSGHLSGNITFPEGYMKQVWNMARYLGVRESFIQDWQPTGGIEFSLIDMLTQAYFQWQYWLEQAVRRSETKERQQHPEYARWMARREEEYRVNGWTDGHWFRPFVSEQQALDSAVQMADRWNRIYMRTLRQLRDLRRYAPVTINNPGQVNIAADGGQQVNVGKS